MEATPQQTPRQRKQHGRTVIASWLSWRSFVKALAMTMPPELPEMEIVVEGSDDMPENLRIVSQMSQTTASGQ